MIDWSTLPPGTPIWASGGLGVAILLLTFSERAAKIKGPLGALARYWNERQIREVERRATLNQRIEELVQDRVNTEMASVNSTLTTLKEQVAELQQARADDKAKIAHLEEARDLWAGYSAELTAILYRLRQWVAERGWELPEKITTFREYKQKIEDAT